MKSSIAKLKLEALTPIHIGSGTKYNPLEYYTEGGRLVRVDFYKVCSHPAFKKHHDKIIIAALNKQKVSIGQLDFEIASRYPLYSIDMKSQLALNEINEHIKTNLKPYIPGSSLKGSILTALAYDHFKNNRRDLEEVLEKLRYGKQAFREIINKTIGSLAKYSQAVQGREGRGLNNGFARWLRISDPEPAPIECLFAGNARAYPSGPQISMEMLKPGTSFEYEVEPSEGMDIDEMLGKVNEFYTLVLEHENKWRTSWGLKELNFGADKAIIRVGTGSSKVATSLLLLLNRRKPKTRKLVEPEMLPMGWASLCRKA